MDNIYLKANLYHAISLPTEKEIMSSWQMESRSPVASIICITFNHAQFLQDALRGFLIQKTEFPYEIIVHDDASTDGTSSLIERYQTQYPHIIKYVRQEKNQYSQGKRILPLALPFAKGRYVALCEGDDYWTDPLKLQKQVSFLETYPEYVITYHRSQPFDEHGELAIDFGGALRDLTSWQLKTATPIFTLTACFRNVISEFPPEIHLAKFGDLFYWSLLGAYGKGKFMEDISPARYRVHDSGAFSTKSYSHQLEMRIMTRAALFGYYWRISDKKLAYYFKRKLMISCFSNIFHFHKIFGALDFLAMRIKWILLDQVRFFHGK